jgi:hypothetical protein
MASCRLTMRLIDAGMHCTETKLHYLNHDLRNFERHDRCFQICAREPGDIIKKRECFIQIINSLRGSSLIDYAVQRHKAIFRSALSIREGQRRRPSNMQPAIARTVVSTHPLSGSKCRMRNPTATRVPPSPSRTRHALGIAAKFTGVPYRMRNHCGSSITPNPVSTKPTYQTRSATEVGATNTRTGEATMKMTSKKMPPILCPRVRCRQSNICPLTMRLSDAGLVAPETRLIYPDHRLLLGSPKIPVMRQRLAVAPGLCLRS